MKARLIYSLCMLFLCGLMSQASFAHSEGTSGVLQRLQRHPRVRQALADLRGVQHQIQGYQWISSPTFGVNLSLNPAVLKEDDALQLSFNQTLLNPKGQELNRLWLEKQRLQAENELYLSYREVWMEWQKRLLSYQYAQKLVQLRQNQHTLAQRHVAMIQQLVELGKMTPVDFYQAQQLVLKARSTEEIAFSNQKEALKSLALHLQESELSDDSPYLKAVLLDTPLPGSLAKLQTKLPLALDWQNAVLPIVQAQLMLQQTEVNAWPQLSVGGQINYQYNLQAFGGLWGVSVPIPVWQNNQNQVLLMKKNWDIVQVQAQQFRLDLKEKTLRLWSEYQRARSQTSGIEQQLSLAKKHYERFLTGLRIGVVSYPDLLRVTRDYFDMEGDFLNAQLQETQRAQDIQGLLFSREDIQLIMPLNFGDDFSDKGDVNGRMHPHSTQKFEKEKNQ